MVNTVRVFGLHKAGTSFLMKSLTHFCHMNDIALLSSPIGFLPLQAYDSWGTDQMGRNQIDKFFKDLPGLRQKFQKFSEDDFKDVIENRLNKLNIFSIGDMSKDNKILFYRNSSVEVFNLYPEIPAIRVIRNPMSIVKSAYFSHLNTHKVEGWTRLERQRVLLDSVSQNEGMWETYNFLKEEIFFHCTEGPLLTLAKWPDDSEKLKTYKMEEITASPSSFLLSIWQLLGGELETIKFVPPEILTFKHQSGGRKLGEVDATHHLRSGNPEEWRSLLPSDLIDKIREDFKFFLERHYPDALSDHKTETSNSFKHRLVELEKAYVEIVKQRNTISTYELKNKS